MGKDRIKGAANQAKGTAKEVAGKITGDSKLKTEGALDKVAGKAQNATGGAKDALRGKWTTRRAPLAVPAGPCVHLKSTPTERIGERLGAPAKLDRTTQAVWFEHGGYTPLLA